MRLTSTAYHPRMVSSLLLGKEIVMYMVQVKTIAGKWSADHPCHLIGDLDERGFHRTIESARQALDMYATNDGRPRRIYQVELDSTYQNVE